jgi:hypothetical protein
VITLLTRPSSEHDVLNLRVGELVEVRSAPEILATLDENGEQEGVAGVAAPLGGQALSLYRGKAEENAGPHSA